MSVRLPRPKPFRFSIQASAPPGGFTGTAADGPAWRDLARRTEDLGYSSLTIADHLDEQFAATPAIVSAAEATSTLLIGTLVWCNDYHHPAVLAKEAATIDVLSGGRLEFGLGAGWMTTDYEQAGIPLDRPGVRIDRMAEAITIIKGLFGAGPVDFSGAHYTITGLEGTPKPVQSRVPFLIGGGGRRILSIAAREADIIGINVALTAGVLDATAGPNATAEATEEKLRWIAEAAGDRYDDLELQTRVHLAVVTDDRESFADAVAPALGLTGAQALETPHALAGTDEQLCDTIVERRERFGLSYVTVGADAIDAMAPVVARLAGT
ncbi:MAG: TIGR03621 family F420-dependent LLM class oxidoreductase [Acidimicrobiia bacterium]